MGAVELTKQELCARATRWRRREPAKAQKRAVKTPGDKQREGRLRASRRKYPVCMWISLQFPLSCHTVTA